MKIVTLETLRKFKEKIKNIINDFLPMNAIIEIPDDMIVPEGWEEVQQVNEIITSYGNIFYTRVGNLVHLEGTLTGIVGQYQGIATLPSEIVPREEYHGWVYISGTTLASILIRTDGKLLAIHNNMNGGDYIAGDILRLNITYLTN